MLKNEKIKAAEVLLTGLDGEALGIVPIKEALALARAAKVDLVCDSLMSSPPPCRLVSAGAARQEKDKARKQEKAAKVKEIRFTVETEEHDLETKVNQAKRILQSGDSVLLTVKITGKEGVKAKGLLEELAAHLQAFGRRKTGFLISGKQAQVELESTTRGKE